MMWKALSLALGVTLVLAGIELFFVEELEIRKLRPQTAQSSDAGSLFQPVSFSAGTSATDNGPTRLFRPQDWMPWSLLAVGSIIVIYTFTIPGRSQE